MADETMEDSAWPLPPAEQPAADCVLLYGPGDTPHTWTPGDIAEQKARYRLPGFVRSNPGQASYVQDANAFVAWLKKIGAPKGCATFLDLETAVAPGYVSAFGWILHLDGYLVLPYGSLSTIWQNPHLDGLFTAHYTGVPHLCTPACGYGLNAAARITQYANAAMTGGPYDRSLIASDVPLWDAYPSPPPPPTPPPSPLLEDPLFILAATGRATQWWQGSTLVPLVDVAHVAAVEALGVPVRQVSAAEYDLIAALLA